MERTEHAAMCVAQQRERPTQTQAETRREGWNLREPWNEELEGRFSGRRVAQRATTTISSRRDICEQERTDSRHAEASSGETANLLTRSVSANKVSNLTSDMWT